MRVANSLRIAILLTLCSALQGAAPAVAQTDPLPSWNDCAAKRALIEFAKATTAKGGPQYVAPELRIAVFDHVCTLWV